MKLLTRELADALIARLAVEYPDCSVLIAPDVFADWLSAQVSEAVDTTLLQRRTSVKVVLPTEADKRERRLTVQVSGIYADIPNWPACRPWGHEFEDDKPCCTDCGAPKP